MRSLPRVALAALLLACSALPATASLRDVLPGFLGSIVLVDAGNGTGTAFAVEAVAGVTRFLTNSHVIEGATALQLVLPSGQRVPATALADDPAVDLALLEAAVSVPPLPLWEGADPPLSSDLAVVGFPLPDKLQSVGMSLQPSVAKGILSAIRPTRHGVLFQVDVPINPGNSGGPGMDWDTGKVVGVASSGLAGADDINFLVGIPTIREFLAERPVPRPQAKADKPLPIAEALKALELEYTIDDSGDFRMLFDIGNGRTHLVFIRGQAEAFRGYAIREIFSPAFNLEGPLTADLARRLLVDSQACKLGGWQMRPAGQVEYSVKVEDRLTPEQLKNLMDYVLDTADDMELEVTGKDLF